MFREEDVDENMTLLGWTMPEYRIGSPVSDRAGDLLMSDENLNLLLVVMHSWSPSPNGNPSRSDDYTWRRKADTWMAVVANATRDSVEFSQGGILVTIPRQENRIILVMKDAAVRTAYLPPGEAQRCKEALAPQSIDNLTASLEELLNSNAPAAVSLLRSVRAITTTRVGPG